MKKIISFPLNLIAKITMFVTAFTMSMYAIAQDKKIDVTIDTKADSGSGVFNQPWVWVVGGAVFLLLLVALLRNNSSKNS